MVRGRDACWEYCELLESNRAKCKFCQKIISGGITRVKHHLARTPSKDVNACPEVREEVIQKVKLMIKAKEETRRACAKRQRVAEAKSSEVIPFCKAEESPPMIKCLSSSTPPMSQPLLEGPQPSLDKPQLSLDNRWKGNEKENAERSIALFLFENNLSFKVTHTSSYHQMLDAISNCGHGFKGPSSESIRTTWLQKIKSEVQEGSKDIMKEWETAGCTIMSDGWTDNKSRALINFLVSSPSGVYFIKSVDASGCIKNVKYLFHLFDSIIQEVGHENVVQVITDNASNYVAAGELIMQKYKTIFWSPCATHCLDLILEDIGKLNWVNICVSQAQLVSKFIYNNIWVLNLMREYTEGKELVCLGVTRSATNFISLQSMLKQKSRLKDMFNSEEYRISSYAITMQSMSCVDVLEDQDFWLAAEEIVAVSEPLVDVLKDIDGERAAIGSLYVSMSKAREAIKTYYAVDADKCKTFLDIIENRWAKQLHSPLHAAGAYLNPSINYTCGSVSDAKIKEDFFKFLERILPTPETRRNISKQIIAFKKGQGMFGFNLAIEDRNTLQPGLWWEQYGDSTPELQRIAVRVLSQVCSVSICGRNWSSFQQIHFKKHNKLVKETLNDLVYINYNLKLASRAKENLENMDPLTDTDLSSEWVEDADDLGQLKSQEWDKQIDSTDHGGDLDTGLLNGSALI